MSTTISDILKIAKKINKLYKKGMLQAPYVVSFTFASEQFSCTISSDALDAKEIIEYLEDTYED